MCGIAGIVASDPRGVVETSAIRRMCQTLVHRGPDDEGVFVQGPVALGMRRLSIIDLATGRQPIHNENRTIWVVLNGEIYNFPALRDELKSAGHCFYTGSDTEVIVHLYEEYGADCVHRLRGMFAFAIYDQNRRSLLLARDRLGKKPLHYALSNGRLLFASEIKALLAVAPELTDVDPDALLSYFCFGYICDPQSAFREIRKLPPGHLLEFAGGNVQIRKYWDLPTYGGWEPRSEEECLVELERRLEEAVRIRLISDVPLGALLSGGVDSSAVVALMTRVSSGPVKTFSIGFRHADFDEAAFAREVASHFRTDHHELIVEPDIAGTLEHLTRHLEEPFADASMVPTYLVSQLARRHVTVALSGDGGDELFAGYDRYAVALRRRLFDFLPDWMGASYRQFVHPWVPPAARGRWFAYNLSLPLRERYLDSMTYLSFDDREPSLFSQEFLAWLRRRVPPQATFRAHFDSAPADDPLGKLQYLDTKTNLPADILTKVDRMSMAVSLEVRCPILDHVVVEWATQLSPRWKIRFGEKKYLLKKLAERLAVPRRVLYRRKQGFSMPLMHWLKEELRDELQILLEPRALQRGYFDRQAIENLLDEHMRGRRNRAGLLWLLLIFELWHRNFLEAQASAAKPAVLVAAGLEDSAADTPSDAIAQPASKAGVRSPAE